MTAGLPLATEDAEKPGPSQRSHRANSSSAAVHAIMGATVTGAIKTRRKPVQERSRRTVRQILDAAEQIISEKGVDAVTTRAVSERAGVGAPSLYRFFADREEMLDALLDQMSRDLDEHVQAAEAGWESGTIADLINLELDAYAGYYKTHPTAAALWFGGRASAAVVESIRNRNDILASRLRALLIDRQLVSDSTPIAVFALTIELGDRILEATFRDPKAHNAEALELGKVALAAFLERWAVS
jgi:AcrR family transcriptional regulator